MGRTSDTNWYISEMKTTSYDFNISKKTYLLLSSSISNDERSRAGCNSFDRIGTFTLDTVREFNSSSCKRRTSRSRIYRSSFGGVHTAIPGWLYQKRPKSLWNIRTGAGRTAWKHNGRRAGIALNLKESFVFFCSKDGSPQFVRVYFENSYECVSTLKVTVGEEKRKKKWDYPTTYSLGLAKQELTYWLSIAIAGPFLLPSHLSGNFVMDWTLARSWSASDQRIASRPLFLT